MTNIGGFGPSTGRIVEVGESAETRFRMKTVPVPPVAWALAFAIGFLGLFTGMGLIYQNEVLLGVIVLIAVVAIIVLMVVWTARPLERNPG